MDVSLPESPSNHDLFMAEDGLLKMFELRKAADWDTTPVETAYTTIQVEMIERGLMFKGLPTVPGAPARPASKPVAGPAAAPAKPAPAKPSPTTPPDKANSGAGADPDAGYTPHPFVPSDAIASICATCGRPIADHVGKGYLDSLLTAVEKTDFSNDQRRQYAEQGVALPDGSFPIPDEASLHNAVRLVGHANDPQAAMTHIIERAKAMGMTHALPPAWNVPDAGAEEAKPPAQGAHQLSPEAPKPGASGGASKPKPATKALAEAMAKMFAAGMDETTVLKSVEIAATPDFEQCVVTKSDEKRYTQGPVYMPGQLDAHKEWTTYDELQKAMWDYVAETGGDRSIYLQHSDVPAGKWVEVFQWHSPVAATMKKSVDGVVKSVSVDLPAGTAYMGVIWTPEAWELVKAEKITGFSMGGWAKRIEAEIESQAA